MDARDMPTHRNEVIGPGWREMCGVDMEREDPKSSPGYVHSVDWARVVAEEKRLGNGPGLGAGAGAGQGVAGGDSTSVAAAPNAAPAASPVGSTSQVKKTTML